MRVSGDCPRGLMVCFRSVMLTKPQVFLGSTRSRHQRSDGDCVLRLGTPVASTRSQMRHTIRPLGQSPLPGARIGLLLRLTPMGNRRTMSVRKERKERKASSSKRQMIDRDLV